MSDKCKIKNCEDDIYDDYVWCEEHFLMYEAPHDRRYHNCVNENILLKENLKNIRQDFDDFKNIVKKLIH